MEGEKKDFLEKRKDVHLCSTACEGFLREKRPIYCKVFLLQPHKHKESKDS